MVPNMGASFQEHLAVLRQAYVRQLPGKLQEVSSLWHTLRSGEWDAAGFQTLHRLVHGLTGSGATYGFAALSEAARTLERCLHAIVESGRLPTAEQYSSIDALLDALQQSVAGADSAPARRTRDEYIAFESSPLFKPHGRLILVLEDHAHLGHDLAAQIANFGYTVQVVASPADLLAAASDREPAAIVAGTTVLGGDLAGYSAIQPLHQAARAPVPVIAVSSQGDIASRLQAVRAGVAAYFTTPVDISTFIDKLDTLTAPQLREQYRILIVEDDPSLAAYYAVILQQVGMTTVTVTHPLQVMQALNEFSPDLLLMDVYMPDCTGLELAAVIRQQAAYVSIPIVFLSAETDLDKQLAAMHLGGDDFLTKPIQPDHLVSAVASRVQRSRILRSYMVRDSLTGLLNHTRTKEQLQIEVARAQRQSSTLTLAMIDIDHFKRVNDTYGHLTGDTVIKSLARLLMQRFRKTDVIGRYGGEEFAVILPDTPIGPAENTLNDLRERFAHIRRQAAGEEFSVTLSCGLASYPDYPNAAALGHAADQALYAAKRDGRNRVVPASSASS